MDMIPEWALEARRRWPYRGRQRPDFAIEPGPGQESVWDYPRPPRVEADSREVVVRAGDVEIARTHRSIRVMETASPPVFYIPPDDVCHDLLEAADLESRCEWKGAARYWHAVVSGRRFEEAAWSYPDPFAGFDSIRNYFSFYPTALGCQVGRVPVRPQPGGFYGGWWTPEVVGPFKGEPGSESW